MLGQRSLGVYSSWGRKELDMTEQLSTTLEKEMATHSGILAWNILWTEESGGLQFMGSQRVGHWVDAEINETGSLYFFKFNFILFYFY